MIVYLLFIVLTLVIFALSVKIYLMKKSAEEIKNGLAEILSEDTNTLLCISSNDKTMRGLAAALNGELKILRRKRQEYDHGDSEIKRVITGLSHDLRTPLTAVSGYAQLLLTEEMSEKARAYSAAISERAADMSLLTEELLQFSVGASEEKLLEKTPLNITALLNTCLADHYTLLSDAGIVPAVTLPDRLIKTVSETALRRVFNNILSNAAKYSDGDLRITADDSGNVSFSNKAVGLTNVQAGRLFDRFYTVNEARRSTGVGLSVAKALMERMGGSLSAEYKDGILTVCCHFAEG